MQNIRAINVINIASMKAACKDCSLRELCLPLGLEEADLSAVERLVKRRRTLKKGEALYRVGDPLHSLFAIRTGTFKSTGLMEDGRVQVTGFYLPGELLGMDAIGADRHPCTTEALETSGVCEIPFNALEDLAQKIPGLQRQLLRMMSREIARDEGMLMMLGHMSAEERFASCLLSFSQRHARLGANGQQFKLGMSRQELGDYLGLALETISRLFSRFRAEGLIEVQGRHVSLRDSARLQALATGAVERHVQA